MATHFNDTIQGTGLNTPNVSVLDGSASSIPGGAANSHENKDNAVLAAAPPKSAKGRKAFACDVCRRRKVRCDLQRPTCSNCERRGTQCIYRSEKPPTISSRSTKSSSTRKACDSGTGGVAGRLDVGRVSKRSRQLPIIKPKLTPQDENPVSPTTTTTVDYHPSVQPSTQPLSPISVLDDTNQTLDVSSTNMNTLGSPTDLSFTNGHNLSTISASCSPDTVNTSDTSLPCVSADGTAIVSKAGTSPERPLVMEPPPELVQHLVALYVSQTNSQIPLFTLGWMQKELAQGKLAPALTYAMMAVASRSPCAQCTGLDSSALGRSMAKRAADMLQKTTDESLSRLQAIILMDVYHIYEGEMTTAFAFRRYAQR
jgi:hypothetical protein